LTTHSDDARCRMRALINLMLNLPWWGNLILIGVLVGLFFLSGWWIRRRFEQITREAVLEGGAAMKDAQVVVHAVEARPMPSPHSPYDIKEDDEDFVDGVDNEPWDDMEVNYYAIDATITPADPNAQWDPTNLTLVPADYVPEDEVEISEQMCPLHSADIFVNGRFQPAPEQEVRGPQRLRMLFAVHDGLRAVKFGMFVTYFGKVDLPAPLPKTPKPEGGAVRR
jgi:hypothetical protein